MQTSPPALKLRCLSRSDLIELDADHSGPYMEAITEGLVAHARGQFVQPLKPYLRWPSADHIADRIIAMPAYLGGTDPVAGIKWIGSREHNPRCFGLERASALIVLNDTRTNYPVSIMEGALISGMRTGAVTAVAARHLARSGSTDLACLGCGPIGRMQVQTLLEQFPSIRRIHLYDLVPGVCRDLAQWLETKFPGKKVLPAASAEAAVRQGDVVVTCTVANAPYLEFAWLKPGTFISNASIMDVAKEVFELADKVVVDDWDQSNREKKIIHQLVSEGRFSRERHAELGEIVSGQIPGREREEEIILLNPMGMAIDDLVCARKFYHLACERGIGTLLSLY